jgi:pimeloyl-ACP methyl ester carboxylesterase
MNTASTDHVTTSYAAAPTRTLNAAGETFAYRELGPKGGIPVVFFVHLGATLDNWDPRIVDAVAAQRHVIAFDQLGVGASSGKVPGTIEEAADDAYAFVTALGFSTIDVVSFSLGGFVAQDLAVRHPDLVRRLVLTGTGPRGGTGIAKVARVTYLDVMRAGLVRADPKEFLFFNRDAEGKKAGKAFIQRLQERTTDRDKKIRLSAFTTQLKAIKKYGRSAPSDLSVIKGPTLIANGDHDRMVPTELSHDLHRRIPDSEMVIYPHSGHGGIFQYHEEFAPLLADFLADDGDSSDE